MGENQVDFVILTAIELERQAVCQALQMGDGDRIYKGIRTYWRKQLAVGNNQYYEIAVTQLPDAAAVDAALAVADAIIVWNPSAILMVGIAGAARESVKVGDLVIGQEVYYYERGKDALTGHLPEPKQYPANAKLWDRVISISQWEAPIPIQRPDATAIRPAIHRGVIASGERVIANAEIRDEIAKNNRKIDAIEMEGYGVSAAAWKQDKPVPCLVIRGISDRADAQKNDDWQVYATTVAAEFTKHFLLNKPLPPRNYVPLPLDESSVRYRLIIEDLKNGNLVPFLGPGINAGFYIDLALKLAESVQQTLLSNGENNEKHEKLIQTLIGIPCSVCHYWPQDRPPECPMLKGIDGEENISSCPLFIEQGLAVSKINLRYLSQYYILRNGVSALYYNLYEILSELEKSHQSNALPEILHQCQ
ncbi:MAG TPA: 5'-methylthioadenosine/S-adenosylhomocysteine nucleosidase [Leptolyngbyaceae cyanobacterium M33_DOE_097]|nr:5'-methylthioadenosine/S-adenosylhomocysteine nucleosidase [Leptolyngbyaceae cyanobacterium M33_DOE_097]